MSDGWRLGREWGVLIEQYGGVHHITFMCVGLLLLFPSFFCFIFCYFFNNTASNFG